MGTANRPATSRTVGPSERIRRLLRRIPILGPGLRENDAAAFEALLLDQEAFGDDRALELLDGLLRTGADPNAVREPYRTTPLAMACVARDERHARFLLGAGADPDAVSDRWRTPLHECATRAPFATAAALAAELASAGARHLPSPLGIGTPLHLAARCADARRTLLMLETGADPAELGRFDRASCLHGVHDPESIRILDRAGAPWQTPDADGFDAPGRSAAEPDGTERLRTFLDVGRGRIHPQRVRDLLLQACLSQGAAAVSLLAEEASDPSERPDPEWVRLARAGGLGCVDDSGRSILEALRESPEGAAGRLALPGAEALAEERLLAAAGVLCAAAASERRL